MTQKLKQQKLQNNVAALNTDETETETTTTTTVL